MRTSPSFLREQVLARDRGICSRCTVDTLGAHRLIRRSRGERRRHLLALWGLTRLTRRSLWDADHIVPVVEGGGECDLENLRTLCLHCHRVVTRALQARRRAVRLAGESAVG
ncbi:MAG TPA: HNH endonuclease signature motif containing protein [Acidobacteriaceae bacterium]